MPMMYCMFAPLLFKKSHDRFLKIFLALYPQVFILIYIETRNFLFFTFVYGATVVTQVVGVMKLSKHIESIVPLKEL